MKLVLLKPLSSIALLLLHVQAVVAKDSNKEAFHKRIVLEFYEAAINRKDYDRASTFLGTRYIQHNQTAADGKDGLRKFLAFLKEKFPNSRSEIKKVFTDGDYVILHVHAVREPGTKGIAIMDIFRMQDGKIVEHWDVHEEISSTPANDNGMF
ncbi:SnoaL-like polyketide cyclase [Leptospira inadai serovar Lyme str. 10]|uniref:SnoaL-like polyketide cyclase n=2 Tax=Leptospira inadai serovar Lyme TaxID=293084 RepID=V6HEA0_9LEPT|nr:ester cyclase [Leptospira inadai]EQA37613.1 SnoaL-like polyketide cyclase [Leptospira inadai serovar Lyme str. 10]PNV74734.1 polyketide cyclase [Leptospira inadai serovar Lyme]